MSRDPTLPCPCCSGKRYQECCEPYHKGAIPKSALDLMRSRYSAYALNLPEYIVKTTHPASPQYSENRFAWKRSIAKFSQASTFLRLEILDKVESETHAVVLFTAFISQGDSDATFTEKSSFEKIDGKWMYRSGKIKEGHLPNVITTGQLRALPMAYYGDPILRKKCDPVPAIDEEIETLVEEMVETMELYDGMGLAAPQVHHAIRLFITQVPLEKGDGSSEIGEVKVFINPLLSEPSEESWKAPEACLSIPTVRAEVVRPKEISVEYTKLDGSRVKERFSGWEAKAIMHENDHINGVLFVDRLDEGEKKALKPQLQKLKSRIHDTKGLL